MKKIFTFLGVVVVSAIMFSTNSKIILQNKVNNLSLVNLVKLNEANAEGSSYECYDSFEIGLYYYAVNCNGCVAYKCLNFFDKNQC